MRITIKQRGGFVGDEVTLVAVDTSRLDPQTCARIEGEVRNSGLLAGQRDRPVGSDLLEYQIEVEDGGTRETATWVDDGGASAEPVRHLIARLSDVR